MIGNLMEWDELNLIRREAREFIRKAKKKKPEMGAIDEFLGYMEYTLCRIFMYGWRDAEKVIGPVRMERGLDDKTVWQEIKGETFRDRAIEQIDKLSEEGLLRIIDTEAHRDYNAAVQLAAERSDKPEVKKKWNTVGDDKVRETHDYLEGAVVGINDRFYTFDGDSALAPGGFELPENNVNCRCWITLAV